MDLLENVNTNLNWVQNIKIIKWRNNLYIVKHIKLIIGDYIPTSDSFTNRLPAKNDPVPP